MKTKLTTLLVAGCALAATTVSAQGMVRDNCGCGFGTMALGDETGLLSHLAATFLNGISGNQTFGISSGTLNCDQASQLVSVEEVEIFVADNMDHLAADAAVGEGVYLNALADLLQVEDAKRATFYADLQVNFDKIFMGPEANANGVTRSIVDMI